MITALGLGIALTGSLIALAVAKARQAKSVPVRARRQPNRP